MTSKRLFIEIEMLKVILVRAQKEEMRVAEKVSLVLGKTYIIKSRLLLKMGTLTVLMVKSQD